MCSSTTSYRIRYPESTLDHGESVIGGSRVGNENEKSSATRYRTNRRDSSSDLLLIDCVFWSWV
jgi:hypothetical protein